MKRCRKCEAEKPLAEFVKDKRRKDGCTNTCLECDRTRARETTRRYRERHPGIESLRYHDNPDPHRERRREEYRQRAAVDPEYFRERSRRSRAALLERDPDYFKRWYQANKARQLENVNRWNRENRDKQRETWTRRRVLVGPFSPESAAMMAMLMEQPCSYCGAEENIEIDHIEPLSRGGKHTPDNLASACRRCNRSKGSKLLTEWEGPPDGSIPIP